MVSIELKRRIRWADADAAHRLHFPRMFEYFEEGETELLRSLGITMYDGSEYGFPRKHVEAVFHRVLPLDAPFILRVSVGKLGRTSIRYDFQVFADDPERELALEGSMTVVTVRDNVPVEIPESLRRALSGD
ncbi:MAG: acyl-CoA thioesterase [Blastocatellales bacterium]